MTSAYDMDSDADRAHSFDPDVIDVTEYDDRAPRVVKVADPVVQKRNRNNRKRGKKTETEWAKVINGMIAPGVEPALVVGILGDDDVRFLHYSFECKHRHMGWPSNTVIKKALVQAETNAGTRTPVVVACMTTHNSREWRIYTANKVFEDGRDWLRKVLA